MGGSEAPHELVQDAFYPDLHAQEVESVVPQQPQEVNDEPVALLKDDLLSVEYRHVGRDRAPLGQAWRRPAMV